MTIKQKRELAETLYINTDFSQREIARKVDVTEKTLGKWIEAGNWTVLRSAKSLTRTAIIANFYEEALMLQEQVKKEKRVLTAKEVDMLAKIAASIEKLDAKETLENYIHVFKRFNEWMVKSNVKLAQQINELQDHFIRVLAGKA